MGKLGTYSFKYQYYIISLSLQSLNLDCGNSCSVRIEGICLYLRQWVATAILLGEKKVHKSRHKKCATPCLEVFILLPGKH